MSTQSDFFRDQFKKLVAWELQEVLESSPCEFLSFLRHSVVQTIRDLRKTL